MLIKHDYVVLHKKRNMISKINEERRRSMNPHTTQQQEQLVRSPGEPQTKTVKGTRQSTDRLIT
jgi:hypothetical protein